MRGVVRRLRMAQVASCGCLTKTPDPKHHSEDCLYRVLQDAIDALQLLSKRLMWSGLISIVMLIGILIWTL